MTRRDGPHVKGAEPGFPPFGALERWVDANSAPQDGSAKAFEFLVHRGLPPSGLIEMTMWFAADRWAASMISRAATESHGSTGGGAPPSSAAVRTE
jgi:hypothetical protein